MRTKGQSGIPDMYKCCFCCHVKTGTLFYGLFQLICHLFLIGVLIFASIHPEILQKHANQCTDIEIDTTMKNNDIETQEEIFIRRKMNREDFDLAFIICLCMLTIVLFLLYGVLRNRPGYILPFFCLQVFDFCLSCLTVVGYLSYSPNIKIWLRTQGLSCVPGLKHLMDMDSQWLMLLCLLGFILFLSVKAYLIGMVWSCYNFLKARTVNGNQIREYTVDPDSQVLLPPKYEEAMRQGEGMPPAYTA
ncbi:lysosomal-associated transmembrane protein 4A-like [Ostrea edulis]|uniref:lysosomal-associated transmembrane protein 4A-like n=1 Tax=Ostrea edulis TaxID=37623 RepID=UPI0020941258|nr:lysosomal-associated transmembrane protein 4A-like [Ostrea edulis]